mgnify:CR=1 FL=1
MMVIKKEEEEEEEEDDMDVTEKQKKKLPMKQMKKQRMENWTEYHYLQHLIYKN